MVALTTLLKLVFFVLIYAVLLLMIFAIPIGLEIFFFEKVSQDYTFKSICSIKLLDLHLEVNMGFIFVTLLALYILCFMVSFRKALDKSEKWIFMGEKKILYLMKDHLFALPLLSSLAYVASKAVHFIQGLFSIPLGEAPISKDPLVAFLELSISPLVEELIFRILPMGTFLAAYLLDIIRTRGLISSRRGLLKFLFSVFLDPERGKRTAGLRTIKDHGLLSSIELREWLMIALSSAIFSFSHYSSTWEIGKLTSSFIEGSIMGLSYITYGFQAPILIHWFFNYYLYTYSLAKIVNPNMAILVELNEYFIIALGVSGLAMAFLFRIKSLREISIFNAKFLIVEKICKLKINLEAKYSGVFGETRHVSLKSFKSLNFLLLFLVFVVFVIRLSIINFPSPENGEKYYETGFIFDEVYYVKAARFLLKGESVNNEHPPLVKLFIMFGILLFGDNPVGWRLFPIIFSSSSIIILYILALKITKSGLASFSTVMLFTFDIMVFNIGQIAMLDAPSLAFIFVACIMMINGRYDLSGIFFGLALLCKLSSLFSLGILFFPLLRMIAESGGSKSMRRLIFEWILLSARTFLFSSVIFLLGIWIYDAVYGVFSGNPLNHLICIINYHSTLKYQSSEDIISPLRWINPINPFSPVPYHVVTRREMLDGGIIREYHPVAYYGIYSPLWWSIWIIIPLNLKEIIRDRKITSSFVFIWITTNFLPYIIFAYPLQRWVYPFYFCSTLPGLYMCLSYNLISSKKLRILLISLISLQITWFTIWFPVKPKLLIDLFSSFNLPV